MILEEFYIVKRNVMILPTSTTVILFEFCIIKRIVMTPQLNIDNSLRATKHIILQARRYLLRKNEEHCKIALFANKKCPKLLNMLAPEVVKCQGAVET